jgi:endonuclease-3 related protein
MRERDKKGSMRHGLMWIYKGLLSAFGPQGWWPGNGAFEVIVGAILTQNTAWRNVERAIENLKAKDVMNPDGILGLSLEELASLIRPAGYFNVKAKRLRSFIEFFFRRYGGSTDRMFNQDLYELRSELIAIHGIGEETADSILLYAGGKPIFVVDAYTRRFLLRHRLIESGATYGEIQGLFMDNLEPNVPLFNEYHALIVRLGKEICKPRAPACKICPINGLDNVIAQKAV